MLWLSLKEETPFFRDPLKPPQRRWFSRRIDPNMSPAKLLQPPPHMRKLHPTKRPATASILTSPIDSSIDGRFETPTQTCSVGCCWQPMSSRSRELSWL